MPTKRNMPQAKPQDRAKHEEPVERSLNPRVNSVRTRGTAAAKEPPPKKRSAERLVQQGDRPLRGGRERAERRGGSAVSKVQAPARQHRARSH